MAILKSLDRGGADLKLAASTPNRVRLAVTPCGPGVRAFQAFHTSVLLGDVEYAFGNDGLAVSKGRLGSHRKFVRYPAETFIVDIGTSRSHTRIEAAVARHFSGKTYDVLRKNCNSFTDVALYYLLGQRLDEQYCMLEKLGASVDRHLGIIGIFSGGLYTPNPLADDFVKDDVLRDVQDSVVAELSWPTGDLCIPPVLRAREVEAATCFLGSAVGAPAARRREAAMPAVAAKERAVASRPLFSL